MRWAGGPVGPTKPQGGVSMSLRDSGFSQTHQVGSGVTMAVRNLGLHKTIRRQDVGHAESTDQET
jgi:hypothetical protein